MDFDEARFALEPSVPYAWQTEQRTVSCPIAVAEVSRHWVLSTL